jgi:hypothetical protein
MAEGRIDLAGWNGRLDRPVARQGQLDRLVRWPRPVAWTRVQESNRAPDPRDLTHSRCLTTSGKEGLGPLQRQGHKVDGARIRPDI